MTATSGLTQIQNPPARPANKARKKEKGGNASTVKATERVQQVFLLDLGSVSHLEAKDAEAWVAQSFEDMKSRNCEQEVGS